MLMFYSRMWLKGTPVQHMKRNNRSQLYCICVLISDNNTNVTNCEVLNTKKNISLLAHWLRHIHLWRGTSKKILQEIKIFRWTHTNCSCRYQHLFKIHKHKFHPVPALFGVCFLNNDTERTERLTFDNSYVSCIHMYLITGLLVLWITS